MEWLAQYWMHMLLVAAYAAVIVLAARTARKRHRAQQKADQAAFRVVRTEPDLYVIQNKVGGGGWVTVAWAQSILDAERSIARAAGKEIIPARVVWTYDENGDKIK